MTLCQAARRLRTLNTTAATLPQESLHQQTAGLSTTSMRALLPSEEQPGRDEHESPHRADGREAGPRVSKRLLRLLAALLTLN